MNLPRSIFSRGALATIFLAAAGCVEEPAPKLRIGAFQRPGFEPLFLARSLGYFDERHVQLVEFPSSAEMLLAWRNHAIDAATVTTDDVLRLAAEQQPLRIVLAMAASCGEDVILARPPVHDVAALKGRKVAVESNALGGYVLVRALEGAGLGLRDVQIVSGRLDRLGVDLSIGNVDAVVAHEPHRTRLARRGVAPIFDSASLPGEIAEGLIVRAPLAEHPAASLRQAGAAWFRAVEYLREHPGEARERMAARLGLTPEELGKAFALVEFTAAADQRRELSAPDAPLLAALRTMSGHMARAGMLPAGIDPSALRSANLFPPSRR